MKRNSWAGSGGRIQLLHSPGARFTLHEAARPAKMTSNLSGQISQLCVCLVSWRRCVSLSPASTPASTPAPTCGLQRGVACYHSPLLRMLENTLRRAIALEPRPQTAINSADTINKYHRDSSDSVAHLSLLEANDTYVSNFSHVTFVISDHNSPW